MATGSARPGLKLFQERSHAAFVVLHCPEAALVLGGCRQPVLTQVKRRACIGAQTPQREVCLIRPFEGV